MMPDEEVELDDDDYVLLRSTISSPPFAARESANTNDDEVAFGVGETMNADSNWCAFIQAVQTVGDSANTSSIALNEATSKKLVEELTEFWGWDDE